MKKMKRLAALFLAVVMVMAMGMTAFAAPTQQTVPTGKGGEATITIRNPKAGMKYTVYKVFDATKSGEGDNFRIAYTLLKGQTKEDLKGTGFEADANGYVTTELTELSSDHVTALVNLAKSNKSVMVAEITSNGNELVFTGLEYGYYVVTSGVGAAVSIDSTTPNMVINDKNPTGPSNCKKEADNDLVQVGGRAEYTVTFNTANYETKEVEIKDDPATDVVESGTEIVTEKIYQYIITDTVEKEFLSEITVDSVKVYNNAADEVGTEIKVGDAVPQFDAEHKMTIDWTSDGTENGTHLYPDGAILEIKYHGTVNNKIEDGQSGNTNKVQITWNGNPKGLEDDDDVYTASVIIDKVNGQDKSKLAGAVFVLLDREVLGTGDEHVGEIPRDANYYMIDKNTGAVSIGEVARLPKDDNGEYIWPETAKVTTDENGAASFSGLQPGNPYYLLEIEAPDGFNRLEGTTEFNIGSVLEEGSDAEILASITALKMTQIVENNAGVELPSTGGIGTTIFYVVGGILVVGAGVLLITKKRMSAREK